MTIRDNFEITLKAGALMAAVYDAVQQTRWIPRQPDSAADATPEAVLRTVLTFCYATGINSSEEIETATVHDPVVRYLCANHRPNWETIREFRRTNVSSIKIALARLFQGVLQNGSRLYPALSMSRFIPAGDYTTAAGLRLSRAVQADSYALDL